MLRGYSTGDLITADELRARACAVQRLVSHRVAFPGRDGHIRDVDCGGFTLRIAADWGQS
jgi:hypothetical protein